MFSSSCPELRSDELRFEAFSGIVGLVECPAVSMGVAPRRAARVGGTCRPSKSQRLVGSGLGDLGSWGLFSERRCFASKVTCSDDWRQEKMTFGVCSL